MQVVGVVGYILYVILGFFQLFATIAGVQVWLGLHWFFALLIAAFFSWIPIIGTVLGVVGAHYAWGWSWLAGVLLFFGPFIVIAAMVLGAKALDKARAR